MKSFLCSSCTEQVLALTSHIGAGFQRKLKTGVIFIDLTAAYDTEWRDGLILKFMRAVPCAKLSNFLNLCCQTVSSKSFLVIKADGVDSIMDYL
jgi:hypothetical protein